MASTRKVSNGMRNVAAQAHDAGELSHEHVALAPLLLDDIHAASRLLDRAAEGSLCPCGTLPPARALSAGERVWTESDVGGHDEPLPPA